MAEIVTSVKRWVSRVHVSTPIQVASSEPCHCAAPSGETRQSQRARVHWLSMLSWAAEISDKAACRGGVLGPSWTWLEGLRCFEGDSLGIFIFLVKLLVYCCLKCHFGFGRCSHCPGFCFSSGWGSPLMPCSARLLSRVFGVQLGADRVVTVLLRSLLDSLIFYLINSSAIKLEDKGMQGRKMISLICKVLQPIGCCPSFLSLICHVLKQALPELHHIDVRQPILASKKCDRIANMITGPGMCCM